jgi:hypothetical protein
MLQLGLFQMCQATAHGGVFALGTGAGFSTDALGFLLRHAEGVLPQPCEFRL